MFLCPKMEESGLKKLFEELCSCFCFSEGQASKATYTLRLAEKVEKVKENPGSEAKSRRKVGQFPPPSLE